jgi:carbohydrate diacid regulator
MQLNDTLARQRVSRATKILSSSVKVMDEPQRLVIASGYSRFIQRSTYAAQ